MSDLDVEGVLAGQRCRDVHGDTYTAPWCYSCRGWAEHVATVLREQIAAAQAEVWDEGWDARTASAHVDGPNDRRANPYRVAQLAPSRDGLSAGAMHAPGCNVEHTDAGGCRRVPSTSEGEGT